LETGEKKVGGGSPATDPPAVLTWSKLAAFRVQLAEVQRGLCPVCGRVIQRPCLDHHHRRRLGGTGLIRGVLCSSCNVFVAKSENNCVRYGIRLAELPTILRSVATYLEQPPLPFLHPSEAPPVPKLQRRSYAALKRLHDRKPLTRRRLPPYPYLGRMTKPLAEMYNIYKQSPEYYK
jgi:hypothetical protein